MYTHEDCFDYEFHNNFTSDLTKECFAVHSANNVSEIVVRTLNFLKKNSITDYFKRKYVHTCNKEIGSFEDPTYGDGINSASSRPRNASIFLFLCTFTIIFL